MSTLVGFCVVIDLIGDLWLLYYFGLDFVFVFWFCSCLLYCFWGDHGFLFVGCVCFVFEEDSFGVFLFEFYVFSWIMVGFGFAG